MLRSLPAVIIASAVLIGAPVAATAITLSSVSAAADTGASTAQDVAAVHHASESISPAVWVWGATGVAGLAVMFGFGATVVRRGTGGVMTSPIELRSVDTQVEASAARYA